jgi:hypothetical protein
MILFLIIPLVRHPTLIPFISNWYSPPIYFFIGVEELSKFELFRLDLECDKFLKKNLFIDKLF